MNVIRFFYVAVLLFRLGSPISATDGCVLEGTGCRLHTGLIRLIILFSLVSHCIAMRGSPGLGPPSLLFVCFFSFQSDLVLFAIDDGDRG